MLQRFKQYKNNNKQSEALRRSRFEFNVQIRKLKKDENLNKRRNINSVDFDEDEISIPHELNENIFRGENLSEIYRGLQSSYIDKNFEAVQRVRKSLSSECSPPIEEFIQSGLLPHFVKFLQDICPAIRFEAAWALTNVASGSSRQTEILVEAGALLGFKKLLSSPHQNIVDQSVWALGNIIGDSGTMRNTAISFGIVEPVLALIKPSTPISVMRNISWIISNMCRHKDEPLAIDVVEVILPYVRRFMYHMDEEILTDACWSLSHLSDLGHEMIELVIKANVVNRLVELLGSPDSDILAPTIRAIGNLLTGNDLQTQYVIDSHALPPLKELLSHKKQSIVKEAVWSVSNIAAGTSLQIEALLDNKIVEPIVTNFFHFDESTQKEAAWVFRNICSGGTPDQLNTLLDFGVLPLICHELKQIDSSVILLALETLRRILDVAHVSGKLTKIRQEIEEIGALNDIESVLNYKNFEIHRTASEIIDTYFYYDETRDHIPPSESQSGFNFTSPLSPSKFTF